MNKESVGMVTGAVSLFTEGQDGHQSCEAAERESGDDSGTSLSPSSLTQVL